MLGNLLFRIKCRLNWEIHEHWDRFYRHFCFIPTIYSFNECVDLINKNHLSLARFGDGEIECMYGKDLNFQEATPLIRMALRRVSQSAAKSCLIGIPDVFINTERLNKVEQDFWRIHFYFHRRKWYSFLKKDTCYANAFLSRFYSREYDKKLAGERVAKLKTLWDGRNVIFIEGKDTKLGVGNDLFANVKSIRRIIAPSKNAFDKYKEILETSNKVSVDDPLFFIALGPTATVLAYDLSQLGYQALDMGHIDIEYEWYKMGATSKVPITGKFTNEAVILNLAESEVIGRLEDDEYEKQIIARIL